MTAPIDIIIRGAREHNLKNLNLTIPRNKITVLTGLSGSGKSSLAFDTIYAEGQRRYIDSLSSYARNFLDQLKKPEVDAITGLSPAIAIDQKSVGHNPRSTVGTVTEVYDYLRLLFAKVGVPECPTHHIPVTQFNFDQIVSEVLQLPLKTKFYILAPVVEAKKGEFKKELQKWERSGIVKVKVDGVFEEITKVKKLTKTKSHDIDLIVDQLVMTTDLERRLRESINRALSLSQGRMVIELISGERKSYSQHSSCSLCGFSFPDLEPRLFSFNNPRGACLSCHGLGTQDLIEEADYSDSDVAGKKLNKMVYKYKGQKVSEEDEGEDASEDAMELSICEACSGARLKIEALNVKIFEKNIAQLSDLSLLDLSKWFKEVQWSGRQKLISEKIVKQIQERLDYLIRVGTGYLSLSRTSRTLSGGESQRIRLASQVGSALRGVLYVMDEPSIGLHPRDHHRLLEIIRELRDRGNTVILVEHDEDTMLFSDYLVDLGPRAGKLGGEILAQGTPEEVMRSPKSITGQYLSKKIKIQIPTLRRKGNGHWLELNGAQGNNLKNVDLKIPLGTFISMTGVSGSGKSTLVIDTLYRILARYFYKAHARPEFYKEIKGVEFLDKVIDINQRPIGRTPRSTPATYVGLFPLIRDLFAALPESRLRGYTPGMFSFNVKGGRCEACRGHGQMRIEMHFLSDVFVGCETCQGKRYSSDILAIKYNDKSIADVLAMTVEDAFIFFKNHRNIHRKIETLHRVGLDYMSLGQSSTTLSGGEAQRVKLSKELSKRGTSQTLYILDEPTTGLHFEDIKKLIELLQELVDQGNTVMVIEHNLDVIKCSDYVVDLGPEGGHGGGQIVVQGTPEDIVKNRESETGRFLKKVLI
ncbi:MAG TPA: excinuclease ABC subunit UvrA [Pseudobdellovibrionaceae bacterium]|nr:excinuclease ABC subunit UvrA [Pseudobdellovibrionaceae bacterium]